MARTGHAGGEVRRSDQTRLELDVIERFPLVPDVVAGGHHVDTVVANGVTDLAGDAVATGSVLYVGHHQVEPVSVDQRRDPHARQTAPRFADDVTDEQNLHVGPSGPRVMGLVSRTLS